MLINIDEETKDFNKEVSESLKQSKKQNPYKRNEENDDFEYHPNDGFQFEERKFSKVGNEGNSSQKRTSTTSQFRSTIPINPFYAEVVDLIKTKKWVK